ncbi:hypothetical protein [Pseudoflavonifractor phocaeensis]|uniref:hypothetical protein n=1 Tax=Pseudoflavonifractor phocaeensis TaxID=1870988 RepID=UPI00195A10C6|nr:hypothetical protein [Pseudoflavonifractor phocaeensis]MBM6871079.1 hypothetical protein [Pseudoflavonifractor phocaeensis]
MVKRCCRFVVAVLFALSCCICIAFADTVEPSSSQDVIYFEDGSYLEIEIVVSPVSPLSSIKEAEKIYTYKTFSGENIVSYTLFGRFEYDGTTSESVYVDYRAAIYKSGWDLEHHDEGFAGNKVSGTATFSGPNDASKTIIGSISCDKDGRIS